MGLDGGQPVDQLAALVAELWRVPSVTLLESAAESVPWRAEPLIYASDLAERLPEGLTMPRGLRVDEREDQTAVLWLEAVDSDPVEWGVADSVRAARLLGRLSASRRVAPLAGIDPQPWDIETFVAGRLAFTVLPGLYDDATWRDPVDHWARQRAGIARYALEVLARTEAAA